MSFSPLALLLYAFSSIYLLDPDLRICIIWEDPTDLVFPRIMMTPDHKSGRDL